MVRPKTDSDASREGLVINIIYINDAVPPLCFIPSLSSLLCFGLTALIDLVSSSNHLQQNTLITIMLPQRRVARTVFAKL